MHQSIGIEGIRLQRLRDHYRAGERVPLDDVLDAAGLTEQERHVVRERLAGRSYGRIAAGGLRKPGGGAYSRQRVQQIERDAADKLGLAESLAVAVHGAERLERLRAFGATLPPPARPPPRTGGGDRPAT